MKARLRTSYRAPALALAAAVALAAITALVAAGRAEAAAGSVFEVPQVIAEIKRQLAAAEAGAGGVLRIEDAQLDLALVEIPGGRGGGFVVPGADYSAAAKEAPRPALKRRLVLEVQPARTPPAEAAAEAPAPAGGGGGGRLAQAIGELRTSVQQTMASDPAFELKKFTIDLDFALERDGKGALQLVLFARDKRIEPANVHGLKLRFTPATPSRGKEAAGKERDR